MKRLTVRIDDYLCERLGTIASENNTSINKLATSLLEEYIIKSEEVSYIDEITAILKKLNDKLEKISKTQYKHFLVSKQHFANIGYLSNADIKLDKCLNEILNNKDNFND